MRNHVDALLQRLLPQVKHHLSDAELADLACQELPLGQRWIARRHLAGCADCMQRLEALEGAVAERMLPLYRTAIGIGDPRLPDQPRMKFANWLELQTRETASSHTRIGRVFNASAFPRLRYAVPVACSVVGLGLVVMSASLWWHRVPRLSTNAFLVRAEEWDSPGMSTNPGVVHQRVVIRTNKVRAGAVPVDRPVIERSISWDRQGKLRPRKVRLSESEQLLKSELEGAGVDWDRPVSAAAYQAWHDHQHVREDHISRSGLHLLTLTTTVPDGTVSRESITVRDSDFHPVRRTVDFRESGTVDIAEVDFQVLPWSAADAGAFEPIADASRPPLTASPAVPASLTSPRRDPLTATPAQLEETELAARLILNQLHADNGEQIEILRTAQGIEVNGLVQTDERKRELRTQLMTVPRLKVSIQSVADLANQPANTSQAIGVESAALPDNPSALSLYLRQRGKNVDEINALAQHIFSSAMTVGLESRAILELQSRFHATRDRSVVASATLAELLYSHHEHLEAALHDEQSLLAQTEADATTSAKGFGSPDDVEPGSNSEDGLAAAAAENLKLSKELTETNMPGQRDAQAIFAGMKATIARVAAAERDVYAKAEENFAVVSGSPKAGSSTPGPSTPKSAHER